MADSLLLSPSEIVDYSVEAGVSKANRSWKMIMMSSILAGAFVSLGAVFSMNTLAGTTGVIPYGIAKLLAGTVFSVGLISIIFTGTDLFTSSTLLANAAAERKITWGKYFANIFTVYFFNLIGALIVVGLLWGGNWFAGAEGAIGKTIVTVASHKAELTALQAFCLGIFANVFVCLAVWFAWAAKTPMGKIVGCMIPVAAFAAAGFEHSIANMFYFPAGIIINETMNLGKHIPLDGVAINMIFSTLGNLVGGALFVGLAQRAVWKK